MAVKISLSSEEESGRPLLSGHTKAFQVTSEVVAELFGLCEESALCSQSEECSARKVLTSPSFRPAFNTILLLPLLRLCPGNFYI